MGGFPVRPDRSAFGPDAVDRFAVRDPTRELAASIGNLLFWQVAGMGIVCARAVVKIAIDGLGVPTIAASAEAWDPKGLYIPTITDGGPGSYLVSYAATYPDKDGTSQTTNLEGAAAFVQTTSDFRATAEVQANKREVEVRVRNGAGALTDPAEVLLVIW